MDGERSQIKLPGFFMRASFLFLTAFFLLIKTGSAQNTLPLYEKNEEGEVLLLRTDSTPENTKDQFDTVSFLSGNCIRYGKFRKIRLISVMECCTHPDPKFLTGKIKGKKMMQNGLMILGKIESGKTLDYDSLNAKTNLFEMTGEEFEIPQVHQDVVTRYRWFPAELDGKKEVFLQSVSKNNYHGEVITYNVALKNCLHIRTDSTDFFYCSTDLSGNYKKSKLNWYEENIKWSLLYVNKKLIYVTPDFSNTTIRGSGPFHSKEQKLAAIYRAKGTTYYYFSPGFVISFRDHEWKREFREPAKKYDKCDCDEQPKNIEWWNGE
jgi:hypothetical protein